MTMPFYASAEQIMRDRSELARKGISRGRSVVVLKYDEGVLLMAENTSKALRKISEIYDRLGFAAVGKYNEFEALRQAGIGHADMRGYAYDRADVTGRSLANAYAQLLGSVFTEQAKPYEVELCVAEVSPSSRPGPSQLYKITYDGSITDHDEYLVMGGSPDPILKYLATHYRPGLPLNKAILVAAGALGSAPAPGSTATQPADQPRSLGSESLEVATLNRRRPRRAFTRLTGATLEDLLRSEADASNSDDNQAPRGGGEGADSSPLHGAGEDHTTDV